MIFVTDCIRKRPMKVNQNNQNERIKHKNQRNQKEQYSRNFSI